MRGLDRPIDILREHSTSQSVSGIIRLPNDIFIIFELDDNANGSKDLFLDDPHRGLGIGKDGRLDEVAFGTVTFATMVHGGSF